VPDETSCRMRGGLDTVRLTEANNSGTGTTIRAHLTALVLDCTRILRKGAEHRSIVGRGGSYCLPCLQ
jgi:hypothetical protein